MWVYEKKLQFPVNIKRPDPKAAQIIISQYGGPQFRKVYYFLITVFFLIYYTLFLEHINGIQYWLWYRYSH